MAARRRERGSVRTENPMVPAVAPLQWCHVPLDVETSAEESKVVRVVRASTVPRLSGRGNVTRLMMSVPEILLQWCHVSVDVETATLCWTVTMRARRPFFERLDEIPPGRAVARTCPGAVHPQGSVSAHSSASREIFLTPVLATSYYVDDPRGIISVGVGSRDEAIASQSAGGP